MRVFWFEFDDILFILIIKNVSLFISILHLFNVIKKGNEKINIKNALFIIEFLENIENLVGGVH